MKLSFCFTNLELAELCFFQDLLRTQRQIIRYQVILKHNFIEIWKFWFKIQKSKKNLLQLRSCSNLSNTEYKFYFYFFKRQELIYARPETMLLLRWHTWKETVQKPPLKIIVCFERSLFVLFQAYMPFVILRSWLKGAT